jgi:tryptophanyl-tRNA synthetase
MDKIIERMKEESKRMGVEAQEGNSPNNQAWFQWRIMHIRGFDDAIRMLEKELKLTREKNNECKEIAINAIQRIGGDYEDDYNRYKLRFRGLSEVQLNKEYGQSGKTCREILNECIKQDEKINKTIEWIKSI